MSSCFTCKKCLSFAKKTNITGLISNFAAFLPPMDPNYSIIYSKVNRKKGSCYEKVEFKHKLFDNNIYPWIEIQCYSILKSDSKKRIICLRILNRKMKEEKNNTIIFSHGNSTDLGLMFPFLVDLSTQLKVIFFFIFYFYSLFF